MAVRNKAQLLQELNDKVTKRSPEDRISSAELRSVLTDIIDSMKRGYAMENWWFGYSAQDDWDANDLMADSNTIGARYPRVLVNWSAKVVVGRVYLYVLQKTSTRANGFPMPDFILTGLGTILRDLDTYTIGGEEYILRRTPAPYPQTTIQRFDNVYVTLYPEPID